MEHETEWFARPLVVVDGDRSRKDGKKIITVVSTQKVTFMP